MDNQEPPDDTTTCDCQCHCNCEYDVTYVVSECSSTSTTSVPDTTIINDDTPPPLSTSSRQATTQDTTHATTEATQATQTTQLVQTPTTTNAVFDFVCPAQTQTDCNFDSNCVNCEAWGACSECAPEYIKIDDSVPCLHCKNTFGFGTLTCQTWNGAGTCDVGYTKEWHVCQVNGVQKNLAACA